jgi:simple sugar transport system permease protein
MFNDLSLILDSAIRLAAPLIFVALGELVAEKAGTLNISVEGAMLASAFAAVMASSAFSSAPMGLLVGVLTGLLVALVQGQLSHRLTVNQFVVGLTLNIFALGITGYLFASTSFQAERFPVWSVPVLSDIPLVGQALFEQRAPFFAVYPLVPAIWYVLHRTRWGLEVQAVGENPQAADITGLHVNRLRRQAILLGGACAGFAGAYLSIAAIGGFSPNMTAGRGFIAIAAVIFGGWSVRWTVAGCLLFGFMDALRLALPPIGLEVNPQLLIASPYLMAIAAMLFFARRQRQPTALGIGFERRSL